MTPRPARHGCAWTAEEDACLRREWGRQPDARLAARLQRTAGGLRERAQNLGLARDPEAFSVKEAARCLGVTPTMIRNWLQAGLLQAEPRPRRGTRIWISAATVETFIRTHPERVLVSAMDRAAYPYFYHLARRCAAPNAGHHVKRPWTADEDAYLRNHCQQQTMEQMATHLGRPRGAISMRLWRLRQESPLPGYKRQGPGSGGGGPRRPWTPEEDAYLLANVGRPRRPDEPGYGPTITLGEVAAALNRPRPGAKQHLAHLRQAGNMDGAPTVEAGPAEQPPAGTLPASGAPPFRCDPGRRDGM